MLQANDSAAIFLQILFILSLCARPLLKLKTSPRLSQSVKCLRPKLRSLLVKCFNTQSTPQPSFSCIGLSLLILELWTTFHFSLDMSFPGIGLQVGAS